MAFSKGISGNPTGRPKGARNRTTKTLRTLVTDFLNSNWLDFERAYKKLPARDKVAMFEKMLKYSLPSLQSVSINEEFESQLKALTDDQVEELMNRILDHYNSINSMKNEPEKQG